MGGNFWNNMDITATKILNPSLNTTELLKQIVFFGEKINGFIVNQFNKIIPLTDTQNTLLLYTVYLVGIYAVLTFGEAMKKPVKIGIIALFLLLLIGFFKPV